MKNKENQVANNFKSSQELKDAIKWAAANPPNNTGVSKFIRGVLSRNIHVKKYLEKGKS